MSIVYFDSSAFVKLLVEEQGTELVVELWDGCDAAVSSRLADPEVRAALAAARRNADLSARQWRHAESSWEELWAAVRPVELSAQVERQAGRLAADRALRGADAVHLASALAVGSQDAVVAVWDRRLHEGACSEGMAVAPAQLEPRSA